MKETHKEVDLIDYIKIVIRYRHIILAIIGICILSSAIFNLRQPALYEATTYFFPVEAHYNVLEGQVMFTPKLSTQDLVVSILESRKMAERVIGQLELNKIWGIDNPAILQNNLRGMVKTSIERSGLIKLSAWTNSPELSAKIANAYVENIDYFYKQFDVNAKHNIVEILDRAIAPENKMPRNTVRSIVMVGIYSFMFAIALVFSIEFYKKITS